MQDTPGASADMLLSSADLPAFSRGSGSPPGDRDGRRGRRSAEAGEAEEDGDEGAEDGDFSEEDDGLDDDEVAGSDGARLTLFPSTVSPFCVVFSARQPASRLCIYGGCVLRLFLALKSIIVALVL